MSLVAFGISQSMQLDINLPRTRAWTVDLGVRRLKVKVACCRNYIWKPGGQGWKILWSFWKYQNI